MARSESAQRAANSRQRSGRTTRAKESQRRPLEELSRKGLETRERFIAAARSVFEDVGFVDARIADIADVAESAHGSFYNYFDSKDEIFRAVADVIFDEIGEWTHVRMQPGLDPFELIATANARYLEAWTKNRKMLMTIDQVSSFRPDVYERLIELRRRFVEHYAAILARLQRDGVVDPQLDSYHAACALGSMVEQSVRWWVGRGERHDPKVAVETLNRLWAQAIGLRVAK